jgi:hypothetical protein
VRRKSPLSISEHSYWENPPSTVVVQSQALYVEKFFDDPNNSAQLRIRLRTLICSSKSNFELWPRAQSQMLCRVNNNNNKQYIFQWQCARCSRHSDSGRRRGGRVPGLPPGQEGAGRRPPREGNALD